MEAREESKRLGVLRAHRRPVQLFALTAVVLIAASGWLSWHLISVANSSFVGGRFPLIFTLAFVVLAWQTWLYTMERPVRITERQQKQVDQLRVCVPVPVYNEDPEYLKRCLASILNQTRRPQWIYVVDDGSAVDYAPERAWLSRQAADAGIRMTWIRTVNKGKRNAQGCAVRTTAAEIDVYVTVDSDANLAPNAVEELMKPLAWPDVQSVAGIVLSENSSQNLLTRIADLWFVVGQLADRSAASTMGAVLVNSGVLAAYRTDLFLDNLDGYLNETFCGRRVEFSDDSMLTIYALLRGKCIQQPTAFAFTVMPNNISHHIRQYLRWMRGAFIRTWWRFKYIPLNKYAYWSHFLGWVQMMVSTFIVLSLFVYYPLTTHHMSPFLLLVPILIGYGQALRYLTFKRNDESLGSQLTTFAIAPLMTLWAFFVLRVVRWYGMATCLKTGWGTRSQVEIERKS
jgi:hyaluronan synthase